MSQNTDEDVTQNLLDAMVYLDGAGVPHSIQHVTPDLWNDEAAMKALKAADAYREVKGIKLTPAHPAGLMNQD